MHKHQHVTAYSPPLIRYLKDRKKYIPDFDITNGIIEFDFPDWLFQNEGSTHIIITTTYILPFIITCNVD